MDLEWAKDGLDGKLYIIQARPETVTSRRKVGRVEEYRLAGTAAHAVVTGRAVGERIASGHARVIHSAGELGKLKAGEILVAETTAPDWGTVMKRAAAIVTNRGGRTCHAAIVARELGIPAIVGAEHATERIATGMPITVSCAEGAEGKVYDAARSVRSAADRTRRPATAQDACDGQYRQPGHCVSHELFAKRRRRARAHGVHHHRVDQGASNGACRTRSASSTRQNAARSRR